jgi:hypothetical protein
MAAGAPAVIRVPQIRHNASMDNFKTPDGMRAMMAGGAPKATFGSMLKQLLSPIGLLKTTGLSALISFPLAAISNYMDLQQGNINQKQFMTNTLADGAAYTLTGTLGSLGGALLCMLIPIPVVGPLVGILGGLAIGGLLGKLYDDQIRPQFRSSVNAAMTQAGVN